MQEQAGGRSRGQGRGAAVDARDLEETVRAMLTIAGKPIGAILLVDARGFKTPPGHRPPARQHIGTCYNNLRDIVTHRDFATVWSRVTWNLSDALSRADPASPVVVAFYCKSGKHRSVGLAWALTKILRERDWNVELRRTMREYWHIGSCRECAERARDTDEKLALLDDIRPQPGSLPDGP